MDNLKIFIISLVVGTIIGVVARPFINATPYQITDIFFWIAVVSTILMILKISPKFIFISIGLGIIISLLASTFKTSISILTNWYGYPISWLVFDISSNSWLIHPYSLFINVLFWFTILSVVLILIVSKLKLNLQLLSTSLLLGIIVTLSSSLILSVPNYYTIAYGYPLTFEISGNPWIINLLIDGVFWSVIIGVILLFKIKLIQNNKGLINKNLSHTIRPKPKSIKTYVVK
ncbi:MAG: hypothetical protein ABR981_04325 [Candidatus Micrarchaeaceae archaeon]|jgi:hypothetical protein